MERIYNKQRNTPSDADVSNGDVYGKYLLFVYFHSDSGDCKYYRDKTEHYSTKRERDSAISQYIARGWNKYQFGTCDL